jgi:PKD repeat protein
MRPFRGMALALVVLMGAGCGGDDGDGGDGGNGPENQPPAANFSPPTCTELVCTFTDASTDEDGTIASREWAFENGTPPESSEPTQSVTFSGAGPNTVTLTVTDNEGATDEFTREVTLTVTQPPPPPPDNQPPVADFAVQCTALSCSFNSSASTDPDGTIAAYAWNFGEPSSGSNTSTEPNPTHTYAATAVTEFTVSLTVTDDDGATNTITETITVTPPAGLQCSGSGGELVSCTLDLTSKATLTITVTSNDCEFTGNRFRIIEPVTQTVFTNGCREEEVGVPHTITGPNPDGSFEAGTQIQAEFTQGVGSPEDPPRGPPAIRVDGSFPTWTINIDDGGGVGVPGEPDFNDIVLTAQATVVP